MRKAADKSHAGRERREGAVGRESVEMGGGWGKGKLWEGEEDQDSGKEGDPGRRGEEARRGAEQGRCSEKRQMVEELEAEGFPLGHVPRGKGRCTMSKKEEKMWKRWMCSGRKMFKVER